MISEQLKNLKTPRSRTFGPALLALTLVGVGFRLGWSLRPPEYVERVVQAPPVVEYVTVPVEVLPPLPACAGFDFDPDVSGMAFDAFILWAGELYAWAAACSNALIALQ